MKQRSILNEAQLKQAASDLLKLSGHLPLVLTVTEGTKTRTEGQNSRYWCEVQYFMDELNSEIDKASDSTGYTPIEVRRLLAKDLPIEQAVILFAKKPEVVHDVLKDICGIPTSTRLSTKDFMKFEDRLSQTMAEIIGNVRALL